MKKTLTLAATLFLLHSLAAAQVNWSLDNSFGGTGKVVPSLPPGQKAGAVASVIQPDGKIIVAGNTYDNMHIVLMRFHASGSLDSSFGFGGIVETGGGQWNTICRASALALQANGKIVVAGSVYNPTNLPNGDYDFLLLRYNSDGSMDASFGANGQVITNVGSEENNMASIAMQTDGKILIGGNSYLASNIIRYNTNGSLDSTFGIGGVNTIQLNNNTWSSVSSIAIQPDGKIIGGGYNPDTAGNYDLVLTRFNTDGSLDLGFGTSGVATIDAGGAMETITDVLIQPDGKILMGGWRMNGANYEDCLLARCLPDGYPDSSFGTNGIVIKSLSNEGDVVRALALQPDAKIIATGDFYTGATFSAINHDFAVSRFEPDGDIDSSFGNSGAITTDFGNNYDVAYDVSLQPDGKVLIIGESGLNPSFALARYAAPALAVGSRNQNGIVKNAIAYPNPIVGNRLLLAYELREATQMTVSLINSNFAGATILINGQTRLQGRHNETFIIPDHLPTGVYYLKVESNNNPTYISVLKPE